jgi:ArsR family transcriptional regulator
VALTEAARVLKPGGRLLVTDMSPHDRTEYRQAMGHVWQGFPEPRIREWMEAARLTAIRYHRVIPEAAAQGPNLFVAAAMKEGARSDG